MYLVVDSPPWQLLEAEPGRRIEISIAKACRRHGAHRLTTFAFSGLSAAILEALQSTRRRDNGPTTFLTLAIPASE